MFGPMKTVGIYVSDQEKAVDFYVAKLGFEVRRRMQMGAEAEWVEVAPSGAETSLVLYPRNLMPDWAERKPSVVFHCADVSGTIETLRKHGVAIMMEPGDLPWGEFAVIADLDGNWLGLTDQAIVHSPE